MTSTLFRLHRTLWWRSVGSNASSILTALLMALYGFGGLVSLLFMAWADIEQPGHGFQSLTLGVAGGMLIYVMLAIFMPAGENQLSPSTLGALPLTPQEVYPGLLWSSMLTTRAILSVLFSTVYAVAGAIILSLRGAGIYAVPFVLGMVVACLTTIVLGECVGFLGTAIASSEKSGAQAAVMIVLGLLVFGVLQLQSVLENLPSVGAMGSVAAWTPFGAAVGWALSLAVGHFVTALAQLLIALLTAAAVMWLWMRQVAQTMRNPDAGKNHAAEVTGEGVTAFEIGSWSYSSPAAMEFTRALRYIRRDKRLMGLLLAMPMFAVLVIYQLWRGDDFVAYFMLCFSAVMMSSALSNDYGFDGPSNWVSMVAPVPPRVILHARHLAHLVVPFVGYLVLALIVIIFAEDTQVAVLAVSASVGMFIATCAISMGLTVLNPYPLSEPGASRWNDKSGYSGAAFVAAFAGLLLSWMPVVPGIIVSWMAYDHGWPLVIGPLVSLLLPAAVYAVVWRSAGNYADTHAPEIYAKVDRYVS